MVVIRTDFEDAEQDYPKELDAVNPALALTHPARSEKRVMDG